MLDENEVINYLSKHLEQNGYKILQKLNTTQQGIDLIAICYSSNKKLLIEAKGGTSSRQGSNRYGKPYTQTQVFDRVSKGFFTAAQLLSSHEKLDSVNVGLALPDERYFLKYLQEIKPILSQLGILVFIVKNNGSVYQFID